MSNQKERAILVMTFTPFEMLVVTIVALLYGFVIGTVLTIRDYESDKNKIG